jgi:uncharacterized repeat protein (TIGR03803 family)
LPRELLKRLDGNFYVVTGTGGTGYGTVFRLTSDGQLTTLISFDGANGNNPFGGLIQGSDGDFYGSTTSGGTDGSGTILRFTFPSATSPMIRTVTASDGTLRLAWIALLGRSYQLQFKTNFSQTAWKETGIPFVATNAFATASDLIGTGQNRFYRVALFP